MPKMTLYYHCSRHVNLLQWWNSGGKVHLDVEQLGIPLPLSEWGLLKQRPCLNDMRYTNSTRSSVTGKFQNQLVPGQLMKTSSILHHLALQVTRRCSDFARWSQCGIHQYIIF